MGNINNKYTAPNSIYPCYVYFSPCITSRSLPVDITNILGIYKLTDFTNRGGPVYKSVSKEHVYYIFFIRNKGWYVTNNYGKQKNIYYIIKANKSQCTTMMVNDKHQIFNPIGHVIWRHDFDNILAIKLNILDLHCTQYTGREYIHYLTDYSKYITIGNEYPFTKHDIPAKVLKLFGKYKKMNHTLNGYPVYQHEYGLSYIFYCTYYDTNDWRISQTLPQNNSRAPARIRAECATYKSALDPSLFWECVDKDDQWFSESRGVSISWNHNEDDLEPLCFFILHDLLQLSLIDSKSWLSTHHKHEIINNYSIFCNFRNYFQKERYPFCIPKAPKYKPIPYPDSLTLNISKELLNSNVDHHIPSVVVNLLGTYWMSDKILYGSPVYVKINRRGDESYLFYCQKYDHYDWRASDELPLEENGHIGGSIRAFTKHPCSPLEPGLFWEIVTCIPRSWNTQIDAIDVTSYHDPNKESILYVLLTSLGLPVIHSEGWLSDYTHSSMDKSLEHLVNWYNIYHHIRKTISNFQSKKNLKNKKIMNIF